MSTGQSEPLIPPRGFLRMCRRTGGRLKFADSTGAKLTGRDLLLRTLVLRRLLRRFVLADDERHVGILLPPSVAAVVTNAALSVDGRVTINLNYTGSSDVLNECIAHGRIRHIITSRRVMERFSFDLNAELIYLEDFKEKAGWRDKLAGFLQARLVPTAILERWLGLTRLRPDDVIAIIFTSGSTGRPKGVMLTHDNIGSNVRTFTELLRFGAEDTMLGILPLFHSFGFTTTLWGALMYDTAVVFHYTPLEARQVGKLCHEYRCTMMVAAPTFLRSYLRRCDPEDFATLEVLITGAERLSPELADAFENRFGVRPYEGYGTTELSPVVSTNVPPCRRSEAFQPAARQGTVGRPMPGISAKVVDLETGADLGPDQPGMLLIKGPNVMKGYLDQPELTAQVLRDGWYATGDIATIDGDGFLRITGRQSRFSKIGGEMVPHLRIEEALNRLLAVNEEEVRLVVTSVTDVRKGERLVVFHTGLPKPAEAICHALIEAGLPALWIPSPDSFCLLDAIPTLGTGKVDLKQVKDLAMARFGGQVTTPS